MSKMQKIDSLLPGTIFRLPSDAYMRIDYIGKQGKAYAINLENGSMLEFDKTDRVIVLDGEDNEGGKK